MELELPANGSLGPLFYAFGLITREELLSGTGSYGEDTNDTNFLQWLQETVKDAVRCNRVIDALTSHPFQTLTSGLPIAYPLFSVANSPPPPLPHPTPSSPSFYCLPVLTA